MTKNRDEKKYELERELDDLRAFDGNEAKIKRIENRLHEIEIEEEFEEYKKHRTEYLTIKAEHKKAMVFINSKGMQAEWNRFRMEEE
ncbi:MAG: hypothetical protein BHW09_08055 [Clostridium sp. CAG:245_30_32]|jgi:hypothetical protein|nr:MAG: hypothetical protein BHW09_08055 [Clostridium sp. CAG:245_30_32]